MGTELEEMLMVVQMIQKVDQKINVMSNCDALFESTTTNWSCGLEQEFDGRHQLRGGLPQSKLAVYWSAEACLQSYWQFSHDHSKNSERSTIFF